jgi:hypothetical protein
MGQMLQTTEDAQNTVQLQLDGLHMMVKEILSRCPPTSNNPTILATIRTWQCSNKKSTRYLRQALDPLKLGTLQVSFVKMININRHRSVKYFQTHRQVYLAPQVFNVFWTNYKHIHGQWIFSFVVGLVSQVPGPQQSSFVSMIFWKINRIMTMYLQKNILEY